VAKFNPKICDICGKPALYGDDVSWAKCSKCNFETKEPTQKVASQPAKPLTADPIPHKTEPGLTSIIMPVYNTNYPNFHMTGNAIGAIHEHTKLPYETVLIENGSPVKHAKLEDYNVDKVIPNETNIGYVEAVNKGIRASFGEYIAIVTSDTQVYDNWLEDAQEALKHLELVIATPMYGEAYSRAREARHKRDVWASRPIQESFDDFRDGAVIITTKEIFNMVGLLDEGFFNYASDVDLFKKIEMIGGTIKSCKRINIHHIIGATGSGVEGNAEVMSKDKNYFKKVWKIKEGGGKMEDPQPQQPAADPPAPVTPEPAKAAEPEQPIKPGVQPEPAQTETPKVHDSVVAAEAKEPEVQADPNVPKEEAVSKLIRTEQTGDRMYFVRDKKRRWIKNPESLKALGFDFGKDKLVSREIFATLEEGEPIDLKVEYDALQSKVKEILG